MHLGKVHRINSSSLIFEQNYLSPPGVASKNSTSESVRAQLNSFWIEIASKLGLFVFRFCDRNDRIVFGDFVVYFYVNAFMMKNKSQKSSKQWELKLLTEWFQKLPQFMLYNITYINSSLW